MKNLTLPDWYHSLQKDERLSEIGFKIFSSEEIKEESKSSSSLLEGKIVIGESEQFANYNYFQLWFDSNQPNHLLISFNDGTKDMVFSIDPTFEALSQLFHDYVSQARNIPEVGNVLVNINRVKDAEPVRFSNPKKKTVTFLLGKGDWDDDMVGLENSLPFNRFLSLYCICQATSQNKNGNYTQYYTAFSSSLLSLVRLEMFGTTLFYVSYDYVPVSQTSLAEQLKKRNKDNVIIKNFPDDAPIDVLGSVLELDADSGASRDKTTLLNGVSKDDYNSLLYLSGMTYLDEDFDELFFPVASHHLEKFRDFAASEADYRKSEKVIDEAIKHGISAGMLKEIGRG